MSDPSPVFAAGAVCWRLIGGVTHVLLVHRTAYRDVSIPKGKVDPGESLPRTAVREIAEETGLDITLGPGLGEVSYELANGREKVVQYWAAEVSEQAVRQSTFRPNGEISGLEWVPLDRAPERLSYDLDRGILDRFRELVADDVRSTFPIVVLRHGKALARAHWRGRDADRPLVPRGRAQAAALVDALGAWQPSRLVSSPAARCVETITPFAHAARLAVRWDEGLSQDAFENDRATVRDVVGKRVRSGKPGVICTHRPLLPEILVELLLATGTVALPEFQGAFALEPGAFTVVHVSAANPASGIVAFERHAALA